ncbi:MAG: KTSC domain-containing protein [Polaromonas sp.]|nr:KTSC domain-containing protein [Polaromonas sp.]
MDWINANSSNIERFAYDPVSRVLKVEFKNGGTYDYFDVSPSDFQRMCNAPSKGQFLASDIKGKYRYARA